MITIIFAVIGVSLQKKAVLELMQSEAKSLAQSITFVISKSLLIDDDSSIIDFNKQYIKKADKVKNVIISKSNEKDYFIIRKESWEHKQEISETFTKMQKKTPISSMVHSPFLNEEVFHYVYPMEISGITWGWLHISLDLKKYYEKLEHLYAQYLVLFFSFTFLAFVISFYIARTFVRPIVELNKTVSQVSSDNLDVIKVDNVSNDEVGELTKAFNSMISQLSTSQKSLKKYQADLEKRVQERTADLEKANKSLNEKSEQLEELNKNLDTKVKKEIEKRKEQEQMLLQQSRLAAMGEMVGNIAHQWRQPLNALGIIIQNIDLSYKIGKLNEEFMKKSIDESLDLTTMMSKTIDDFRNFFIPNKKKENFLLHESLNSSLELIGSTFKNYNISVKRDIDKGLEVFGFPNEFAQALLNILSNAKDALIEKRVAKPEVCVKLKKHEDMGKIFISDNAGGIDEEVMLKIFEPYFTTKEQGKGTGIGLYMSKMIIEQNMKGKIYAKNIDKGVSFIIEIPLKQKDEEKLLN
ncbi:ATP-binding protein [Arcobacter roscoffensis]|uniref:histidine kinase n=1 Tax=Arcobacter roscoffensis TaxID=2961520 RepID=A0ABY5E204_9BACT|nr:ATP-binding protein [Arcobacter roscoffensis]UTJ06227.1 ATP-binding protein [Arcobacter roscoffensis]